MNKKNTPPQVALFRFSIAMNIVFILFMILIVYYRWSSITLRLHHFFTTENVPTEEVLSKFNNEPLDASNEYLNIGSDSTVSILFLGNSLTYTSVPEEEEDKTIRGLVSSSKEKDYVHQLVRMIAESDTVNVDYSIINIADFERGFTEHSFDKEKFSRARNQSPDWLIVQIGENVAKSDMKNPSKFQEECEKLLSFFPRSRKMITIPFWTQKEKSYALTNVAINSGAVLVDLSHLGNGSDDPNNLANSQSKYKNSIAGTHPGDYGMANIARCFFAGYRAYKR